MKKTKFLAVLSAIALGCAVFMSSCTKDEEKPPIDDPKNPQYERFVSGATQLPEGVEFVKGQVEQTDLSVIRTGDMYKVGFKFTWDSIEKKVLQTKSLTGADTIISLVVNSSIELKNPTQIIKLKSDSIGKPVVTSARSYSGGKNTIVYKFQFNGFYDEIVVNNDSAFFEYRGNKFAVAYGFNRVAFESESPSSIRDTLVGADSCFVVTKTLKYKVGHTDGSEYILTKTGPNVVWEKEKSHNPSGITRWGEDFGFDKTRSWFMLCERSPSGQVTKRKVSTTSGYIIPSMNIETRASRENFWFTGRIMIDKKVECTDWIPISDNIFYRSVRDLFTFETNNDALLREPAAFLFKHEERRYVIENDSIDFWMPFEVSKDTVTAVIVETYVSRYPYTVKFLDDIKTRYIGVLFDAEF